MSGLESIFVHPTHLRNENSTRYQLLSGYPSKKSPYRPISDAYRNGYFELAVSNEVLEEYAEVFAQKMTPDISENIISLILKQTNTLKTDIYYRWQLITTDNDDNKFVDTAISSNADFIVTQDSHFRKLATISFPKVKVINIEKFLKIISTQF